MPPVEISVQGVRVPSADGEVLEFTNAEAAASAYFDGDRRVIFINGMKNAPQDHAESALALSLVQMCPVIGVYNRTNGGVQDFVQCIGDKNQFNGISLSAQNSVAVGKLFNPGTLSEQIARAALERNPCAVAVFDLLRKPANRKREVFAHSQGNLILSNALQAISAVDGDAALSGRIVHTFGSPAANWPKGITKVEHGFTWDPVTWLAGFDPSFSISKVGMPSGSLNPVTHGFVEYLKLDPEFIVNRFRWGSLRMTFRMDEKGLAECLLAMGTNMVRVRGVFEHLNKRHNSDADDVAVLYVQKMWAAPNTAMLKATLRSDRKLVDLLIRILEEGWTSEEEKKAIATLKAL
jgi:hypothetical protein